VLDGANIESGNISSRKKVDEYTLETLTSFFHAGCFQIYLAEQLNNCFSWIPLHESPAIIIVVAFQCLEKQVSSGGV
jgi:hypothetical protein